MARRICCLYVPLFPLAARLRSEPDLHGEAVAVFEGNGKSASLVAATRRARRSGLVPGTTVAQARALLPALVVRPRDPECERAAQEALIEVATAFSPRVQDDGEGIVYLDLTGLERHFSDLDPEVDLARSLSSEAEKAGLSTWIGIASSALAARIAAETPPSPRIVPGNEESRFLAPLPLERLCTETRMYETLQRWGIATIGDFAALPRNQVASRLGSLGRTLHEQARGVDRKPLIPRTTPPIFHEGLDLDWSLVTLEPFLFVARRALERLCTRLESSGLACARLSLTLRLEPRGSDERSILLPAPTSEARTLLTLSRLDLEKSPPGAPITGFTFTAYPDRPREAQLSIFGPSAPSPDKLATTLARLFALLGPDGAGAPRPVDSHIPDRPGLVDFEPPLPPDHRPEQRPGRGLLAVRVLQPALRLEVESANANRAAPATVRPTDVTRGPVIEGEVRVAAGPWKLESDWWCEGPVDRDYWDVELSDGGIYRLFRDVRTGEWFADGIYD
jgi:protein ImuB